MELSMIVPEKESSINLTVRDSVFAEKFNEPLIHQIVTAYLAGARAGTKAQKTRGEVSGSSHKPWKQKHTGRARAGEVRSPIWRKGGVIFAAKPRSYSQKVNKKMYRKALCSIISELLRQNRLVVIENFNIEQSKTKMLKKKLETLELNNVLIIMDDLDENLYLAARNLPMVEVRDVQGIDPVCLMNFEKILITLDGIRQLEKWLE